MAKAESKYIHPLGDKIRKYRTAKGFTQKELGEKCQLNESTIRNYELGNRYPDEVTLNTIADALGIDKHALADPNPAKVFSAVQILFELEDLYGIIPKLVDGEVHLLQFPLKKDATPSEELNYLQMKESLRLWSHIRKVCDDGNLLDEEYSVWKSLYPDYITSDKQFGYIEDPEIEKRIQELNELTQAAMPEGKSDNKPSKRPRKSSL